MFGKFARRLGLLAAGGTLVFAFLLVAQVNMDDLRHKIGDLLEPNDPTVLAGGLYVITGSGRVRPGPPVCRPSDELINANFETEVSRVNLRNSLGYSVPLISRLSALLLSPLGELGTDDAQVAAVTEIAGHTLMLKKVAHTQFRSEDMIYAYADRLYQERPYCEKLVRFYWNEGKCVALVQRVSRSGDTVLGYTYNRACMLPDMPDEAYQGRSLTAPSPSLRLTARLSLFKDYVGILSNEVQPYDQLGAGG